MEPHVHLLLGQVNALVGKTSSASVDIERAIMLAPSQIDLKYLAGFYYLQTGNKKQASRHLRGLLENDPRQFPQVMKMIFGGAQRNFAAIDQMTVARDIVPDDAKLLFQLANKHLTPSSEAKSLALNRADRILTDISAADRESLLLRAEVLFEKGNFADSIEQFESYLDSRPQDYKTHLRVAQIHLMLGDLETSAAKLDYILRMGDDPRLKSRALKIRDMIRKKQDASAKVTP